MKTRFPWLLAITLILCLLGLTSHAQKQTGATKAGSGGGGLPTCVNISDCAPSADRDSLEFGPAFPTVAQRGVDCNPPPTQPSFAGPLVVSDFSDGVSSDGRGPYVTGYVSNKPGGPPLIRVPTTSSGFRDSDGVLGAGAGGLGLGVPSSVDAVSPRTLVVNLRHPVPNGGGKSLGMITVGGTKLPRWGGLHLQWRTVDNTTQDPQDIPVGQTVMAAQMNVFLYISGEVHLLQMGPQPWGHCHAGMNLVTGAGTSSATIYRASASKLVVDLPAGSVGRLFNLRNTAAHAVDRGLYYVHLHYEFGR